ncbi:unnamed protein product [Protopolystoma xenopodis]|uniref:Uncharacterized protein n=1 Tax=Protopolystoma xenopodis TaxID=117903 RepID=A0A3S5C5A6_9PLAT|nr:unnamed protein product [Protopolystoma xenopodis]
MECSRAQPISACDPLPDGAPLIPARTQAFFISTSVSFTKVPSEWKSLITSTFTSTDRLGSLKRVDECSYDSCWRDAFYPWTGGYLAEYKTAWIEECINAHNVGIALALAAIAGTALILGRPFY